MAPKAWRVQNWLCLTNTWCHRDLNSQPFQHPPHEALKACGAQQQQLYHYRHTGQLRYQFPTSTNQENPRLGSITSWNLSIEFGYTNTKENPRMGFIFLHPSSSKLYQNKIELFHGDSVSKWPRLGSTTLKTEKPFPGIQHWKQPSQR